MFTYLPNSIRKKKFPANQKCDPKLYSLEKNGPYILDQENSPSRSSHVRMCVQTQINQKSYKVGISWMKILETSAQRMFVSAQYLSIDRKKNDESLSLLHRNTYRLTQKTTYRLVQKKMPRPL